MASVNMSILLGRVGQQPERKSNNAPVNFSLATHEVWRNKNGEKQEDLQWHNIVVWGAQGDNVLKYVNKGDLLYIAGKIQTDAYNAKDGSKRYTTKIIAREVKFLTPKTERNVGNQAPAAVAPMPQMQPTQQAAPAGYNLDDIPF